MNSNLQILENKTLDRAHSSLVPIALDLKSQTLKAFSKSCGTSTKPVNLMSLKEPLFQTLTAVAEGSSHLLGLAMPRLLLGCSGVVGFPGFCLAVLKLKVYSFEL